LNVITCVGIRHRHTFVIRSVGGKELSSLNNIERMI